MLTRSEIDSQWRSIKEAILQRWEVLGGEELDQARSSAGRLVGIIQQRTGDDREEIEAYVDRVARGRMWGAQQSVRKSVEQHPFNGILVAFAGGWTVGTLIAAACARGR